MGTDCHIVVVGGRDGAVEGAVSRVRQLEARWSRFRTDSELSRLNRAAGQFAVVSADTFDAVSRAVEAWYQTGGLFDPTVLPSLVRLGYDRSFRQVAAVSDHAAPPREPAPGCAAIVLAPSVRAVQLPIGVSIDLGGIGKGLAADRVTAELVEAADGACVNLGGDVRVRGEAPTRDGWQIAVEDPYREGEELVRVTLADGAVVTTSRLVRRWERAGRELHHVVDPFTGDPAATGLAAVTIIAAGAADAEVVAKACFLAGPAEGASLVDAAGMTGLLVDHTGATTPVGRRQGVSWW